MKWRVFYLLTPVALLAGIAVAEFQNQIVKPANASDDPIFKEYLQSLFLVPGKAQDEFAKMATSSPLLTSYAIALFTDKRCATPPASKELIEAAGGTQAFETEAGKRVFVVTGVIATMKFPTTAAEADFCESARRLLKTGETYVSGNKK